MCQDVYCSVEKTAYNFHVGYRNKLGKFIVLYAGSGAQKNSKNEHICEYEYA